MQSQKSPDDILRDAKADKTEFHYSLKKYWRNLQQHGVGASTRTKGYFTVRSFLFHNDIYLGKAPPYFKWRVEWAKRHLLTDKEVFDMIASANSIRNKAIISFIAQSGQRVSTIRALGYGHVRRELESGTNPIVVNVDSGISDQKGTYANKGRTNYQFAVGKQSANYLRQMINHRRNFGEKIDDESWLFRSYDRRPPGKTGREFRKWPSTRGPATIAYSGRSGSLTPPFLMQFLQ